MMTSKKNVVLSLLLVTSTVSLQANMGRFIISATCFMTAYCAGRDCKSELDKPEVRASIAGRALLIFGGAKTVVSQLMSDQPMDGKDMEDLRNNTKQFVRDHGFLLLEGLVATAGAGYGIKNFVRSIR